MAAGGPAVEPEKRRHYRVNPAADISEPVAGLLRPEFSDPDSRRVISGDVLSGRKLDPGGAVGLWDDSVTVLPESSGGELFGWARPGLGRFSYTRLLLSSWLPWKRRAGWEMDTAVNGGRRAPVLGGLYRRFVPLDILPDFLVRAVLAGDLDEAVRLGILETAPEDFALCDYACPSKTEVQEIIRRGLEALAEEGV